MYVQSMYKVYKWVSDHFYPQIPCHIMYERGERGFTLQEGRVVCGQ